MNHVIETKLIRTVKLVATLLSQREYSCLAELAKNNRLSETEIRSAISDYGRTVILPPDSDFNRIDVVEIEGSHPPRFSVVFHLWTLEEGESDLSVELTCFDKGESEFGFELDNIHVL